MGMIVGRDYAYVECNNSKCTKKTEKVYGEDAQTRAYIQARDAGWHKSFVTGYWYCPEHK